MSVREHDQVSSRNFDFLFLAFDLKPPPSPGNCMKAADGLPINAERPGRTQIRPAVDGAANVQVGEHVAKRILSREFVQTFQARSQRSKARGEYMCQILRVNGRNDCLDDWLGITDVR